MNITQSKINEAASKHFSEMFRNAFYIGRHQLHPPDTDRRPHRFYYIGFRDLFGVVMPEGKGGVCPQLWGSKWVFGRSKKLDKALHNAMKGKFADVRHNTQLRARANSHGRLFIKPEWSGESPTTTEKETEALPIRGRRKRKRRKLTV